MLESRLGTRGGLSRLQCLHNPFNETGVQVDDEHPQEGHLLAGVLKDHPGVVGLAAQTVGSHDHGQVVHIHLGDGHVGRLGKYLHTQQVYHEHQV